MTIVGRYQDTTVGPGGDRRVLPWRSNLIVATCYELLAALLKGDPSASGTLWWAVGTGDGAAQPGDTGLGAELHRQLVRPAHMAFVDREDRRVPGPTPYLQISAAFRGNREVSAGGTLADHVLREFGLFGGDATVTPGSGTLINRVVHPPVQLLRDELLERRAILSLGVAANGGARGVSWRGPWDQGKSYGPHDLVHHARGAWIATATTTAGQEPGVHSAWELFAAGGLRGDDGDDGAPGPPGGGGEANTAANVGNGSHVFRDKTGVVINLRSLLGSDGISAATQGNVIRLTGTDLYPRDGSRPATGPFRGTRRDLSGNSAPTIDINLGNVFAIELSGPTIATVANAVDGDAFSVLVKQPDGGNAAHAFAITPPGGRTLMKPDDLESLDVKTGAGARTLVTCLIESGVMIMTATRVGAPAA